MTAKALYIFILFFVFTAAGTIVHECGHYIPAYLYGWEPALHYAQTSLSVAIPASPALNNWKVLSYHAGGMMVNISIGSIGYIILKKQHHLLKNEYLKAFLIVLTFFWSRQIVILISDLRELVYDSPILTDEQKVSLQLSLPKNLLSILLGVIAIYLCCNAVLRFLPKKEIMPFRVAGIIGSVLGYLFWFRVLGPGILP